MVEALREKDDKDGKFKSLLRIRQGTQYYDIIPSINYEVGVMQVYNDGDNVSF